MQRPVWLFAVYLLALPAHANAGSAGMLDQTFGLAGRVRITVRDAGGVVAIQPDGRIVTAGPFGGYSTRSFLTRLNSDGSFDPSFGTGGVADVAAGFLDAILIQPDGRIVIAGGSPFLMARYLSDGTPDPSFGSLGITTTGQLASQDALYAVALLADGSLIGAGRSVLTQPGHLISQLALVHCLADGTLDPAFGSGGTLLSSALPEGQAVVVQPDGKFVVSAPGSVARFLSDGTLDASFGSGGVATTGLATNGWSPLALLPDGKLLVAGRTFVAAVARLQSDGTADPTFGAGGVVEVPAFGSFSSFDTNFPFAMLIDPDGKIVVDLSTQLPNAEERIGRLLPDGTVDTTFGRAGLFRYIGLFGDRYVGQGLARQADGRLVSSSWNLFERVLGGTCGNGHIEAGEDCDDGNLVSGDGCDASCCIADADGDGVCDAVDPCIGSAALHLARVRVSGLNQNSLALSATVPFSVAPNPPLDPLANGVRLIVQGAARTVLDAAIPPGPPSGTPSVGWTVRATPAKTTWTWKDQAVKSFPGAGTAVAGGVFQVTVQRKTTTPTLVHVTAKAKGVDLGAFFTDVPLSTTVVLDPPAATTGECGSLTFAGPSPAPSCTVTATGVTCR